MNIRALVLKGKPKEKSAFWGLYITWDKKADKPNVEFFDASGYTNKPLIEVFPKVFERFGKTVSISGCGMAGERGYANSGVVFNDLEKRATRYVG